MKQTKIAYYLPSATILFYPGEGREVAGGAEMNLYNLAKEMAKDNAYDVSFYVSDDGQRASSPIEGIHVRKVKHLNKDKGKWVAIRRQLALIAHLFSMKEDVVITTTASEHLGLLVLIHQKLKGKKVIFRLAHDYNYDLSKYESNGKRFYHLYKYGLLNCAGLVAQTTKQQKALEALGRPSVVIKNGFEIPKEPSTKKSIVLWVARSKDIKRPELFVSLAKAVPGHNFVMIMPTNNSKKSEALAASIKKSGQKIHNLTIIDYVDPKEIQSYFDEALVFVNTSTFEGFPNTFIQAGLGNTPVLTFVVNPDNMFDKNNIGFCCNDVFDDAVHYLQTVDEESIFLQGSNMRQYVTNNHSIEVACDSYKKLVEGLL